MISGCRFGQVFLTPELKPHILYINYLINQLINLHQYLLQLDATMQTITVTIMKLSLEIRGGHRIFWIVPELKSESTQGWKLSMSQPANPELKKLQ